MKRKTTLLAVGLASALGFTSVAIAADATLYGSVRSGIIYDKPDGGDAAWDLGSVDAGHATGGGDDVGGGDRLWSRIGVKASHDLGNGMTGGLHIEKRLDNFRTRHQNVYLSGAFGKLTLGQQGGLYHPATSWDGTWLFGGNASFGSSRFPGVKYSSMLDGPFSFGAMISDDGTISSRSGEGFDRYEMSASYSADVANVSLGYSDQGNGDKLYGGTVGGSVTGFDWEVGYEKKSNNDHAHYGAFVSYAGAYAYYEGQSDNPDPMKANDPYHFVIGYSRPLGDNTRLILEHLTVEDDNNRTALALKVDF